MGTALNPVPDAVATAPPLPLATADPAAVKVGTAAALDALSLADGVADGLAAAEGELEGPAALVVGTCDVDSDAGVSCDGMLGVLVASVGVAAEVTCSPVGDRPVGVGVLSVAAADGGSTTTVTAVGIDSPPGEETEAEDGVADGDVTRPDVGAAEEDKVEGIGAEGEGTSLLLALVVGTAEVAEDGTAEDDATEDDADKEVAASEVMGTAEVEGAAEVVDGSTDVTASLD